MSPHLSLLTLGDSAVSTVLGSNTSPLSSSLEPTDPELLVTSSSSTSSSVLLLLSTSQTVSWMIVLGVLENSTFVRDIFLISSGGKEISLLLLLSGFSSSCCGIGVGSWHCVVEMSSSFRAFNKSPASPSVDAVWLCSVLKVRGNFGFLETTGGIFLGVVFCGVFTGDDTGVSRPSTSSVALTSPKSMDPFVRLHAGSEYDFLIDLTLQSGCASTTSTLPWRSRVDPFFCGETGETVG